jgi:hypothetical protein
MFAPIKRGILPNLLKALMLRIFKLRSIRLVRRLHEDDGRLITDADHYKNSPSQLALDSAFLHIFITGDCAVTRYSASVPAVTG